MLSAALLPGCSERNQFVAPPPAPVSVAQPISREVVDYIEFTGTTRAVAKVDLRARVNGYLQEVLFEDGAMVEQGDLLFRIEAAPFQAALDVQQADLQKAQAAEQLAQAEYNRERQLIERNVSTQSELDRLVAELATAKANVAAADAAIRQASLDISYTEIRAPLAGRIGRHLVDPGNLVQAELTLLASIESVQPIHVYFDISESDLLRFQAMQRRQELPDPDKNPPTLFMGLANELGFPHEGHLDFRELGLDPSTGTVMRRGVFPNPDMTLVPGLFVRIRAPIGDARPKLLVEDRAIGADQRGSYVLVVNDKNVVEYRPVKLGISVEGLRVVEAGLEADDWLVVNGLQRARPGAEVKPEQVEMTDLSEAAVTAFRLGQPSPAGDAATGSVEAPSETAAPVREAALDRRGG